MSLASCRLALSRVAGAPGPVAIVHPFGVFDKACPGAPHAEKRQAVAKAITCYERGTELDLNVYYCSGNLPRLYRTRARTGDEERAQTTLRLVIAACERAKRLNVADEWLRQTLLAAAFDLAEPDKSWPTMWLPRAGRRGK
jgi:hypothetical protein